MLRIFKMCNNCADWKFESFVLPPVCAKFHVILMWDVWRGMPYFKNTVRFLFLVSSSCFVNPCVIRYVFTSPKCIASACQRSCLLVMLRCKLTDKIYNHKCIPLSALFAINITLFNAFLSLLNDFCNTLNIFVCLF